MKKGRKTKETVLPEITVDGLVERDYIKLANKFAEFELPAEIKKAFKMGMGKFFGGSLGRAKIRSFHIDNKINPSDVNYYITLPGQRLEIETYSDYRNRRKLSQILLRDRNYLQTLSDIRASEPIIEEEQK